MTPWWFIVAVLAALACLAVYCTLIYQSKSSELRDGIDEALDRRMRGGDSDD
jgi:hypothetical protein